MATIAEIKRRFDRIYGNEGSGIKQTVSEEVKKSSNVILDLNRDQLLYGRDSKGDELTPGYLSDPYFKSFEQAKAYFIMKFELERKHKGMIYYSGVQLFPNKDRNTPNLLISGAWFFNHFFINVKDKEYSIGSSGIAASDIELKYGTQIYGLAPESLRFYYFNWLRPAIWQSIINNLNKK